MFRSSGNRRNRDSRYHRVTNGLERVLLLILATAGIAVLAGAVLLMFKMDAGSSSQGGRYFLAIGAMVALGAIDARIAKLMRRDSFAASDYRYRLISLLLLFAAGALLFGLAWSLG